jgi:hypothetical protein
MTKLRLEVPCPHRGRGCWKGDCATVRNVTSELDNSPNMAQEIEDLFHPRWPPHRRPQLRNRVGHGARAAPSEGKMTILK